MYQMPFGFSLLLHHPFLLTLPLSMGNPLFHLLFVPSNCVIVSSLRFIDRLRYILHSSLTRYLILYQIYNFIRYSFWLLSRCLVAFSFIIDAFPFLFFSFHFHSTPLKFMSHSHSSFPFPHSFRALDHSIFIWLYCDHLASGSFVYLLSFKHSIITRIQIYKCLLIIISFQLPKQIFLQISNEILLPFSISIFYIYRSERVDIFLNFPGFNKCWCSVIDIVS